MAVTLSVTKRVEVIVLRRVGIVVMVVQGSVVVEEGIVGITLVGVEIEGVVVTVVTPVEVDCMVVVVVITADADVTDLVGDRWWWLVELSITEVRVQ
jgi:hypothetical protein